MLESKVEDLGRLRLPPFTGVRVVMMPFLMEEPHGSIPEFFSAYRPAISHICEIATVKQGVGYLTIDEALVRAGETHRRPGLHVDGAGPWGSPAPWGKNGMFLAASHVGCWGYRQTLIDAQPGPDGDCEHLRSGLPMGFPMKAKHLYWCSPMALHEALPMRVDTRRQFLRVSMPSDAPYQREYTPNPTGIVPLGAPAPPRAAQMAFRP